jgi:hypothetical protein
MVETWSGPCDGCSEPLEVAFGDDFLCDGCAKPFFGETTFTTTKQALAAKKGSHASLDL